MSLLGKPDNRPYGSHEVRIYYEDTDFSEAVYHPNYLRYFERAREHLLGPDVLVRLWADYGVGFVVSKAELSFREAAKFGDVLEIRTIPEASSKFRLSFIQTVWKTGVTKPIVSGKVEMVAVDKSNKIVPIPQDIMDAIANKYSMKLPEA